MNEKNNKWLYIMLVILAVTGWVIVMSTSINTEMESAAPSYSFKGSSGNAFKLALSAVAIYIGYRFVKARWIEG